MPVSPQLLRKTEVESVAAEGEPPSSGTAKHNTSQILIMIARLRISSQPRDIAIGGRAVFPGK